MLICVIPLSAGQKTYNHDDIQYKMVRYLAQVSNITGPHEVTPVTGSALEKTLSDIDSTALPVRVKRVYDDVLSSVALPPAVYRSQTMMFDLDTVISPQLYFKAGDHAEAQDWFEGYKDRLSLLSLDFDFEWAEYVYGILSFPYKIKYYDRQYDEAFSQNIFIEGSGLNCYFQHVFQFLSVWKRLAAECTKKAHPQRDELRIFFRIAIYMIAYPSVKWW